MLKSSVEKRPFRSVTKRHQLPGDVWEAGTTRQSLGTHGRASFPKPARPVGSPAPCFSLHTEAFDFY